MKHGLAILIVLAFVAGVSHAQVFYPTQDTYLYYDGAGAGGAWDLGGGQDTDQAWAAHSAGDYTGVQESANYGNQLSKQGLKGYQNQMIMDYNRSQILASAGALLGRAATEADFASGAVTLTLSMMKADSLGVGTDKVWPGYMASTTAAQFGVNGYNNYATYNMAQQSELTAIYSQPGVFWNGGVNQSMLGDDASNAHATRGFALAPTPTYTRFDCPQYLAGHNYTTGLGTYTTGGLNANGTAGAGNDYILWTAAANTYMNLPLQGEVAWHYLKDSTNNYLEAYGWAGNSSGTLYSTEQAGCSPYVTLALAQIKHIHPHAGDANNDGNVDVIDLGVLATNYDKTGLPTSATDPFVAGSWKLADFNNDGNVDVIDLGVLATNYDWAGTPAVPTPEPLTLSLLAVGGLALIRRRK